MRLTHVAPTVDTYRTGLFLELARHGQVEELVIVTPGASAASTARLESAGAIIQLAKTRARSATRLGLRWWGGGICLDPKSVLITPWDPTYLPMGPKLLRHRTRGGVLVLWSHGPSARHSIARRAAYTNLGHLAQLKLAYSATYTTARGIVQVGNSIDDSSLTAEASDLWPEKTSIRVLFASRPQPRRRLDLLFDAMEELSDRTTVSAVVTGAVSELTPDEREQLAQLSLTEHIHFIGDTRDPNLLASYHNSATCSVYPAAAGLAPVLSLAHGLPTIVLRDYQTSHGPEVNLLSEYDSGLAVVHSHTLSRAILESSAQRSPQRSREETIARFSPRSHATRIVDAILSIKWI